MNETIERPVRPTPVPVNLDGIPEELRGLPQWVVWNYTWKEGPGKPGKWDKPPYQPTGEYASTTDPRTWSTFDSVVAAYQSGEFDGIGFVFASDDPYVGVDLDSVLIDGDLA